MKRLYVTQTHNPQYFDHVDNKQPKWVYIVDKVTNSTMPAIKDVLTKIELDDHYCASADWEVSIK